MIPTTEFSKETIGGKAKYIKLNGTWYPSYAMDKEVLKEKQVDNGIR